MFLPKKQVISDKQILFIIEMRFLKGCWKHFLYLGKLYKFFQYMLGL